MKKIGFIGLGKMASAIIGGVINSGFLTKDQIYGAEINSEIALNKSKELGIKTFTDNSELVKNVDIIVLSVKPFVVKEVLDSIKNFIKPNQKIISILAGVSTEKIQNLLEREISVVRIMPNTPALLKSGMSGVAKGHFATDEDLDFAFNMFANVGKVVKIDESKIDIVTAISGSGPAYYYYFIEEMAKAGEKLGLDYQTSLLLSAQTALGSAKMIMETDVDVATLIKNVTTPGGCTAVGNDCLNNSDVSNVIFETIDKTAKKAKELGN